MAAKRTSRFYVAVDVRDRGVDGDGHTAVTRYYPQPTTFPGDLRPISGTDGLLLLTAGKLSSSYFLVSFYPCGSRGKCHYHDQDDERGVRTT